MNTTARAHADPGVAALDRPIFAEALAEVARRKSRRSLELIDSWGALPEVR